MNRKQSQHSASTVGDSTVHPMAHIISTLLVAGVTLSAAVLLTGLALLAVTGRTGYHESLSPELILSLPRAGAYPTSIRGVLQGAVELRPFAVIELGALLLIATPVFRVAASIILFLHERDYLYTVITLVVLSLLIISILWIH